MGHPCTFRRILAGLLSVLFGGAVLAVVGGIVGATYGGNYATDFAFNGLRGYEATGQIGVIVGFVAGGALAALLFGLLIKRRR